MNRSSLCGAPLLLAVAATALAQDRVSFIPERATSPVTLIGEVLDYTGRELSIRPLSGPLQTIPAENVQDVKTSYDPAHLQGSQQLELGNHQAARSAFSEALTREDRQWMQREILALLMQVELREQNLAGAIERFRGIVRSDPVTRHWGAAPLVWSPVAVSDDLRTEMRLWMKAERPPERLLGASLLLLDPLYGEAAERELTVLSRDANSRVSAYARAQLWRLELAGRDISDVQLGSWRQEIERMPAPLHPGPRYLLARGYEVRGEPRTAAAEWLWIPYVTPANEPLSARALSDAADALERSGLSTEAATLRAELIVRYPWSREAAQARSRPSPSPGS